MSLPSTATSFSVNPTLEKIRTAPDDARMLNLPSELVEVPAFVPLIVILTPEMGVPSLESVTLPFTSCCACANEKPRTLTAIRINSLFIILDLVYYQMTGGQGCMLQ